MAYENMQLGRVRMYSETTPGVDETTSVASFWDVRHDTAELKGDPEQLADNRTVQRMYHRPKSMLGKLVPELTIKGKLRGRGATLLSGDSAPSVPRTSFGKILKALWGGWVSGQGDTISGVATTTDLPITTNGRTAAGRALSFIVNGRREVMEVSQTANPVPKMALSGAPSNGSAVANCETFYLLDDPQEHLQALVESADRDDIWLATGLRGNMTFDFQQAGFVTWTATMMGMDLLHDDDIVTPQGGSALASETDVDGDPIVFLKSWVLFGNQGSTTRTSIDTGSISISPNFKQEAVPSVSGINGIKRYRQIRENPHVTAKFTTTFGDETYWEKRDASTTMQLFVQVGFGSAAAYLFSLPSVQVTSVVRTAVGSFRGYEVTVEAMEDALGTSTELLRSPIRIHQAG